jgi:hypothetical protein
MFHPRSFLRGVRGEKSLIFQAVGAEVNSQRTNQALHNCGDLPHPPNPLPEKRGGGVREGFR